MRKMISELNFIFSLVGRVSGLETVEKMANVHMGSFRSIYLATYWPSV